MKYFSILNKINRRKKKFKDDKRLPRSYRNKVFRIKKIKNRAYYKKRKALNKLQRSLKKKRGLQKDFLFQDLKFKYTIFKDIFVYKDFQTKFLNYRNMYSLDKRFKNLINLIFSRSIYLLKNRKLKIIFFKYNSKFILSKVLLNIFYNSKTIKNKNIVKNLFFKSLHFKSFKLYRNNEYILNYNFSHFNKNKTKKSVNNFLNQIKVKNLNLLFKSFLNFDYIINNLKFLDYLTFSLKSKLLKISNFFVNIIDYFLKFNTLPIININFLNVIVKCLYKFRKLNLNSNSLNSNKFNFNGLSLLSFPNNNLPLNNIISPLILNNNLNFFNFNSCIVLNSFSFSSELNKNLLMISAVLPSFYKIKLNFNSFLELNKFYINKKQIFRDSLITKQIRLFRILFFKSNKIKMYKNFILDKNSSLNSSSSNGDFKLLKVRSEYKINFRHKENFKKKLINSKYIKYKYNFKCKKKHNNKVIFYKKIKKIKNKKVKFYLKLAYNRLVFDVYKRKFFFKKFIYASSLKYKERGFLNHVFAKRTIYLNKKINLFNLNLNFNRTSKKSSLSVIKNKDYGVKLFNLKKSFKKSYRYPLKFSFKTNYKTNYNKVSLNLLLKLRLRKKIENIKQIKQKKLLPSFVRKYTYWVNFLKRRLKKKPHNYFRYYRKKISKYRTFLKYIKRVKLNILPINLKSKSLNFFSLSLNLKKNKNKDKKKNKLYLKLKKRIFFRKFNVKKKLTYLYKSKFKFKKNYVRPNLLVKNRSEFYLFVNKILYYYSQINQNMFNYLNGKEGIKLPKRKVLLLLKLKRLNSSIYKNKKLFKIFKMIKKNKKRSKKLNKYKVKVRKVEKVNSINDFNFDFKSLIKNFKPDLNSKFENKVQFYDRKFNLKFKNKLSNKDKAYKFKFNNKNKLSISNKDKAYKSKFNNKNKLLNIDKSDKFKKKYRIFNIDLPRFVYPNYSFTQKGTYRRKLHRNRVNLNLYHTEINSKIINSFYVKRSLCKRKTIIFSKISFLSFFKKYFRNLKYLSFYYFLNKYDSNKTFINLNYSSILKLKDKFKNSIKRLKKVKFLNEIKILNPILFSLSKEQRKIKLNYNYNKVKDYVNLNLIKPSTSKDNDLILLKKIRQTSIFIQDLKLVRSKMLLQFMPLNGNIWRCFDELKLFNSQYFTLSLKIKFFSWLYNRIFNLNALITSLESHYRFLYNPWRGIYFCFSIEIYLKQLEKVFFKVFDSNYLINFKSDLLHYWNFIKNKVSQVKNKIFSHLSFYTPDLLNKMNVVSLNLFISQNLEKFKNLILKQSFLIFKLSPDLWKYAMIQKLVNLPVSIISYIYPFYQITAFKFISSGLVFFKELIVMELYDDSLLELKQLSDEFMSYQIFLKSRHKKLLRQKNKFNITYIQISSKAFNFEKRIQLLKFYKLS